MNKLNKIIIVICFSFLIGGLVMADNSYTGDFEDSSSQYLDITDASQTGLDITGAITISAWVKYESLPVNSYILVRKYNSTADQRGYSFHHNYNTGAEHRLYLIASSDGTSGNQTSPYVAFSPSTGIWYHLAVTQDTSGNTKFYINGSQQGSTQTGSVTSIYNNSAPFTIGATDTGNSGFDGLIDDVRIYNAVVDFSDDYDCGLEGDETNLMGYWQFENDWTDSNANDNDLTAYNTPTFQSASLPFTADCNATSTATSTVEFELDEDWYSEDISIIKGRTDIYTDSTSTPSEVRYHYFHIPFFAWIVIFSGIFIIGSRLILEILIRFRNKRYDN